MAGPTDFPLSAFHWIPRERQRRDHNKHQVPRTKAHTRMGFMIPERGDNFRRLTTTGSATDHRMERRTAWTRSRGAGPLPHSAPTDNKSLRISFTLLVYRTRSIRPSLPQGLGTFAGDVTLYQVTTIRAAFGPTMTLLEDTVDRAI